jgi:hypothetical protein
MIHWIWLCERRAVRNLNLAISLSKANYEPIDSRRRDDGDQVWITP